MALKRVTFDLCFFSLKSTPALADLALFGEHWGFFHPHSQGFSLLPSFPHHMVPSEF